MSRAPAARSSSAAACVERPTRLAAGDERDDGARRGGEGRLALRGVERGDADPTSRRRRRRAGLPRAAARRSRRSPRRSRRRRRTAAGTVASAGVHQLDELQRRRGSRSRPAGSLPASVDELVFDHRGESTLLRPRWSIPVVWKCGIHTPAPWRRSSSGTSRRSSRATSSRSTTCRSASRTGSSSRSSDRPGCGKSTLLRAIAGLEEVTSGEISIGGRDVTDLAPRHRDIAMVFQSYALYPHMSVRQNLGYGLKVRRTPKAEIRQRVDEIADAAGARPSSSIASPRSSPADSASGSPWAARSFGSRRRS